jgi:hypothetical protein
MVTSSQIISDRPRDICEVLHDFCNAQREKYGPKWKLVLAHKAKLKRLTLKKK